MTTLSIPVPPHMEEFIQKQIKEGKAANKADVVRRALKALEEEEAIQAVLKAQREPTLKGDLRDIAKKLK